MTWTIRRPVVVPFDFSEHSKAALQRAREIVESSEQLHVLHVLPFLIPTEPGVVWATIDDAHRIQHALENLRESVDGMNIGAVELDVRLGDPGQITADRAEELGAELIVLGSHGRTGLTRMLLGSVAERVVRLAHCPVLVVKIPEGSSE
ncbi:MAG: universal stress protein [Pirellulales bacterium]